MSVGGLGLKIDSQDFRNSEYKTDLGQDELLHWFVPHPAHHGAGADGTEASRDHSLLQRAHTFTT